MLSAAQLREGRQEKVQFRKKDRMLTLESVRMCLQAMEEMIQQVPHPGGAHAAVGWHAEWVWRHRKHQGPAAPLTTACSLEVTVLRENEEWREIATQEVCKLATANLLVLMRVERGGGYHVDFCGGCSQVRAAAQEHGAFPLAALLLGWGLWGSRPGQAGSVLRAQV